MPSVQQILDTEIPNPTFSLGPGRNTPLPSGVDFSRSGPGWQRNADGVFTKKDADQKRISGQFSGLLVEGENNRNTLHYSADPNQWSNAADGGTRTSIFRESYATAGATSGNVRQRDADPIPSGPKVVSCVIGKGSADTIRLQFVDSTDSIFVAQCKANIESSSISSISGPDILNAYTSKIPQTSPNGQELHLIEIHVTDNSARAGNSQYVDIKPFSGGCIVQYAYSGVSQHTPFIPTKANGKNRSSDQVDLFPNGRPDWFNPREGTFLIEFQTLLNRHQSTPLLLDSYAPLVFTRGGNDFGTAIGGVSDVIQSFSIYDRQRGAVSYDTGEAQAALNGEAGSVASHSDEYRLSDLSLSNRRLSHIFTELTYYPQRLPEQTLKSLTS